MKITTDDRLFSLYIRCRDNWACTRCGKYYEPPTRSLHCSHFYGRRAKSTRYEDLNADAHCCGCHRHFEANPNEFRDWKLNQLGEKQFNNLRELWLQKVKFSKDTLKNMRSEWRGKIRDLGYGHLI